MLVSQIDFRDRIIVLGYGFVGSQPRDAGGLASPGFSGTRPVQRNMKTCVDRKCVVPVRWGSKHCLHWGLRASGVCACVTLVMGFAE